MEKGIGIKRNYLLWVPLPIKIQIRFERVPER